MEGDDLDFLLKQIRENPHRYIIIDQEREFTIANFAKKFDLHIAQVNNWVCRNSVRVRNIPSLNNLKLMQMDLQTLVRLKRYDALAIIEREDKLTTFYKTVKMVNTMEWVSKVCEIIDSCDDLKERYELIESLQKKIMESKFEVSKSSTPGLETTQRCVRCNDNGSIICPGCLGTNEGVTCGVCNGKVKSDSKH